MPILKQAYNFPHVIQGICLRNFSSRKRFKSLSFHFVPEENECQMQVKIAEVIWLILQLKCYISELFPI